MTEIWNRWKRPPNRGNCRKCLFQKQNRTVGIGFEPRLCRLQSQRSQPLEHAASLCAKKLN